MWKHKDEDLFIGLLTRVTKIIAGHLSESIE